MPIKCKNYQTCKKDYGWNTSICVCENGRHLKSVADDSLVTCDEIMNSTGSVSTNVTTVLKKFHNKKVRCKIGLIILLFIIAIICFHYAKHKSKTNVLMY